MQPRFVDLHTHTTASDGTDAPRDLIRRAASLKLAAVAVTDHDTVSGLDEAEAAGREYGVEIIRGCELGVQGQYGEIHLLGLWLPRHSAPLDAELARLRGHREERNLKILDRLRSIGINIGYQEVLDEAGGESVGRPHIARVLQKRGIVSNFAQAFELYLGYYGAPDPAHPGRRGKPHGGSRRGGEFRASHADPLPAVMVRRNHPPAQRGGAWGH